MDSKSISRKGVGVRLPSLAPARDEEARVAAARELGAVLVPALCARLREATGELRQFEAALVREGRVRLGDERLALRREGLAIELGRLGYCLGVLGAGARADLLRGRREPRGLAWMAEELAQALALPLVPGSAALPALSARGDDGWAQALLVAWCLLGAARAGARELAWRVERDEFLVPFPRARVPAEVLRRARRLAAQSGAALHLRGGALSVRLS